MHSHEIIDIEDKEDIRYCQENLASASESFKKVYTLHIASVISMALEKYFRWDYTCCVIEIPQITMALDIVFRFHLNLSPLSSGGGEDVCDMVIEGGFSDVNQIHVPSRCFRIDVISSNNEETIMTICHSVPGRNFVIEGGPGTYPEKDGTFEKVHRV